MALVLALSASWDLLALTQALSRSLAALAFALTLAFQLWYLAYQLWLSCIVALVRFCSSSGCFYHQWCPSMRNFALDRVSACKHLSSASRQLAALAFQLGSSVLGGFSQTGISPYEDFAKEFHPASKESLKRNFTLECLDGSGTGTMALTLALWRLS